MRILVSLAASLLLGSCSSIPEAFPEDSVPRTSRPEVIVLEQPVAYAHPSPVAGERLLGGLLPGRYVAEREDSKGIFFRGAGRPQFRTDLMGVMSQHRFALFQGGIWIPKTAGETAKPYFYVEAGYPSLPTFADVLLLATPTAAGRGQDATTPLIVQDLATRPAVSPVQGAIGGAVAAAIVTAAIQSNVGKINFWPATPDTAFSNELSRQHLIAVQRAAGAVRTP